MKKPSFNPPIWLRNKHIQTLVGSRRWFVPLKLSGQLEIVQLPDDDRLVLVVNEPKNFTPDSPIVVLLHGLGGDADAKYCLRLARALLQEGCTKVVRVNARASGHGAALSQGIPHAGRSGDVHEVLKYLRAKHPNSPIHVVGYSLGGNMALHLMGKMAEEALSLVSSVMAVSPSVHLSPSAQLIAKPQNTIYRLYFLRLFSQMVKQRHQLYPKLGPMPKISLKDGFCEFDEYYTAPQSGYRDREDYYEQSSAKDWLKHIKVPCCILYSDDDPFIDFQCMKEMSLPDNIKVWQYDHGGHLGFVHSIKSLGVRRWLDDSIVKWLDWCSSVNHRDAS